MQHPVLSLWHDPDPGIWQLACQPRAILVARNRDELVALPRRLADADLAANRLLASGLISYEAGSAMQGLRHDSGSPLAMVYLYEADQVRRGSLATVTDGLSDSPDFALAGVFESEQTEAPYLAALDRIRDYLHAGDCYQVNYARRFRAPFRGSALPAWLTLVRAHPAPHASFFGLPDGDAVFGVSPERFLQIRGGRVRTEPIKGSRPRGRSPDEDSRLAQSLKESAKDRAENLMIVDLLRNDLGRVSIPGSITTPALFELRQFSNVQHLVSVVEGELRPDVLPLQALLDCLPGGSITGAPKRRAMEIIDELEPHPRGFYCGTQFWMDGNGNLDSSILIRTFQRVGDQLFCHGGGGIVADSDPANEFAESEFKVAALLQALL